MEKNVPKILAVAGKGGVGKTSIAANLVRLLVENFPDKKILAIDADPAVGLSTALGSGTKPAIGCTIITGSDELVKKDKVTLIGKDLPDI